MATAETLLRDSRANRFLRTALERIPDYVRLVELRKAVAQAQRELRGAGAVPLPDSADGMTAYLDAVKQNALDHLAFEAQRMALMSLRGELEHRVESQVVTHQDQLISSLSADLDTLIDAVRAVIDDLDGAATAAEAINAGSEDSWRELGELRRDYDEIRQAQARVVAAAFSTELVISARSAHLDDPLASDLILSDLDELLPGWRERDGRLNLGDSPLPDRRPWPTDDPIAQLVWIARNASPWIPTARQVTDLHQQRLAKRNPKPKPSTRPEFGRHSKVIQTFGTVPSTPVDIA